MAHRNGASVRIQSGISGIYTQFSGTAENLGSKRFINFDDIHIIEGQVGAG